MEDGNNSGGASLLAEQQATPCDFLMVWTSIYVCEWDGSTVLEFQGLQQEQISVCIFIFSLWPQSEAQSLAHETEQVESRWQKPMLDSEPHPTPKKKISPKSEDLISLHHIPELLVLTPGIPAQPLVSLIPSLRKRGDPRLDACKRGQSSPQPGVGVGDRAEGDPCLSPPLSWGSVENPKMQAAASCFQSLVPAHFFHPL